MTHDQGAAIHALDPPHDDKRRAWAGVMGGSALQFLLSATLTQAYGGYVVKLGREFGWSSTTLSGAYALLRFESNLLGPIQGWLTDRFGPRKTMTSGVVMFGLGFVYFSRIDSILEFYLAFVVIAIGFSFAGWTTLAVSIVRAFRSGRSLPMAVAKFGMGLGGLAAPIVLGSMAVYGWRTTALASGVVALVCGLAVTRLLDSQGRIVVAEPRADAAVSGTDASPSGHGGGGAVDEVHFTARQALRTQAFWMLSLGHSCAVLVVAAVLVHLVPFVTSTLGYSWGAAGVVVAGLTGAQMAGTAVGGIIGDRMNRRHILTLTMFMHGIGLLSLTYATNVLMVVFFILMHGLAWGIRAPLQQSLRADYFGAASFGTILGFSSLLVMIGNSGGPLFSGFMVDRTGSYRPGFTVMAVVVMVGAVFFYLAKPPAFQPHAAPRQDSPAESVHREKRKG